MLHSRAYSDNNTREENTDWDDSVSTGTGTTDERAAKMQAIIEEQHTIKEAREWLINDIVSRKQSIAIGEYTPSPTTVKREFYTDILIAATKPTGAQQ